MLQPRLYRAGLLLALAAAVVLMFSVVSRPPALRSDVAADAFDEGSATALTRQLLATAPNREPGSRGDAAAAGFVLAHFRAVRGGQVSEQPFGGSFDGHAVRMRNVTLVLPGHSDRRIVVVAPRDCAAGPCAASSGAATGALLELAAAFDGASHAKTLIFVSTDGSAAGAAGAKALVPALAGQPAEAVIVLSQPGSGSGRHPFVVPWSAGPQSTSIQLVQSARAAISGELPGDPLDLRPFPSLVHLALPSGLGEQAVLIEHGLDAIGLSSAGDRPLPASQDGRSSLDTATLGSFGRATLSLVFALDALGKPLDHGPGTYLPLAGKLLPGWALTLLAIALLLPVGIVSVDGLAAASRAGEPVLRTLLWILMRALPFLAILLFMLLLSFVGLVPDPAFPYDPQRHGFGVGSALASIALLAVFVLTVVATRRLGPPQDAEDALTPAIGAAIFAATVLIWLANPYLALLLVPTAHLWLAAGLRELRAGPLPALAALLLGLALPLVALAYLGASLGVGWQTPWQLVLMLSDGQIGPLVAIAVCALGGCAAAVVELAFWRGSQSPHERPPGTRLTRFRGPGSLGGPPSAAVPGRKF